MDGKKHQNLPTLILICVAMAMGVACVVLCGFGTGKIKDILTMLSAGVVCLSAAMLIKNNKKE